MNFSASKSQSQPPERGSFPLDHGKECTPLKKEFLACLKAHGNEHVACRALSQRYIECRMDRGLMARDDLKNVGFGNKAPGAARVVIEGERETKGFVAGTHLEERKSILPFRPGQKGGGH
mmetsp:Transcript_20609/g.61461  ORF Transcript_20609/g.61461 Transcript_20609/m.61461 type:complete len:120 (-) Transcript_20609:269-628(-)